MNVDVLGTSRLTCTILIKETTLNNKVKHKELYPPFLTPALHYLAGFSIWLEGKAISHLPTKPHI